jgi:outer membrane protein assembly factor BamB
MLSASAAIANGRVYVGTFDGIIHAFDVASGDEVWTAETSYGLSSPITAVGNSVFVGTTDGNIVALDSGSGAVRWNAAAPPAISSHLSSPTVASGVVYVGGANAVYALSDVETPATATTIEG